MFTHHFILHYVLYYALKLLVYRVLFVHCTHTIICHTNKPSNAKLKKKHRMREKETSQDMRVKFFLLAVLNWIIFSFLLTYVNSRVTAAAAGLQFCSPLEDKRTNRTHAHRFSSLSDQHNDRGGRTQWTRPLKHTNIILNTHAGNGSWAGPTRRVPWGIKLPEA